MNFTKIPTGKVLVVSNVSCFASSTGKAGVKEMTFGATNLPSIPNYLTPVNIGTNSSGTLFGNVNNTTTALINGNQIPSIAITWVKQNNSTLQCTIVGSLVVQ